MDGLRGVVAVDGCSLVAEMGAADSGIELVGGGAMDFRCVLTHGGWQRVSGLLEPFLRDGGTGFQYLSEEGSVEWISSYERGW